jgi:hypothetical protein
MSFFEFPHTRTYDGDLGWLIKTVSSYDEVIAALNNWISENEPKIEEIYSFMEQLNNGDIPEGLKNGLYQWASENLLEIVAKTLKTVIFGLTQDGYFIATYTDSWSDITFNTTEYDIWTPLQTEYGHLTLSI